MTGPAQATGPAETADHADKRVHTWLSTVLAVVVVLLGLGPLTAAPAAARAIPGPAAYPEYWFARWNVDHVWAGGVQGGGITVAVLDTGVQAQIGGLRGSVLPGTDFTGLGGNGQQDRADAAFSHGTAMASIITGHSGDVVGVAPQARILPVALPLEETHRSQASSHAIAQAIDYAADHGAKIISMSFGGIRRQGRDALSCPAETQQAVLRALRKGAVLLAAAGNSGAKGSPVEEPSVCLGVLSVGAVDRHDQVAAFSSRHRYLDVVAPGVNIVSLNRTNLLYVGSGTSQATALTAGVLALLWSAHPNDTNRQVTTRLFAGVRDAGAPGHDSAYGYGIIDAGRSLRVRPLPAAANPVFDVVEPYLHSAARPARITAPKRAAAIAPVAVAVRRPAPPSTAGAFLGIGVAAVGFILTTTTALLLVRRRRKRRRQWSSTVAYSHTFCVSGNSSCIDS